MEFFVVSYEFFVLLNMCSQWILSMKRCFKLINNVDLIMLIFEMRDGFSIVVMEEEWCFLSWCEGVVMMEDEFS